jgi:hypothetical protein
MARTLLDTAILEKGLRYVNFFNGRPLSAEDLEHEREATRRHQEQLGRGVGWGIIDGLDVRLRDGDNVPILYVSKGLAINRQGQMLSVPEDVAIQLGTEKVPTATARSRDSAGLFGDCKLSEPQVIAKGTGIYVLLVGPSSALRERVPRVGLRDDGVAVQCDFAWAVEGVQFTVQRLEPKGMSSVSAATRQRIEKLSEASDVQHRSLLRDEIAHAFLGTEAVAAHYVDPVPGKDLASSMTSYGEMDSLWRDFPRLACDVPLAILFWTGTDVHFVDSWSVRRRLSAPTIAPAWPVPTSGRRLMEGEATFQHFQEQLAWVLAKLGGELKAVEARKVFRYLPPAGVLPIGGLPASVVPQLPFFAGRTVRPPVFIASAAIEPLLRQSLAYPPIDLTATDDRGNVRPELVWLYQVRENQRAGKAAERYVLFTTGHMPFYGQARVDVSWWNFSNYSSPRLG